MSNAIIKQQGDSPIVADNIWEIRVGAGSFILGALVGTLVTAAMGRLTAKSYATPKPPTPRGWPINFAHRGGAKVVPENTIEGFREGLPWAAESWNVTYTPPQKAPLSSFMMQSLTGQPMARGPQLRRLSRNCRVLTQAIALARTAVRPFRGEPRESRFPP